MGAQLVSRRQVLAAAYKAVNALLSNSLLTPNVHSEIVVNLNPSNNVRDPLTHSLPTLPSPGSSLIPHRGHPT